MNLAEAQEFRALQTWNHPQDPFLFAEAHVILETHQIIASGPRVFAAELHHRIGTPACARIFQTDWFHRTKAQRIASPARQFLDRQAALEVARVIFLDVDRHAFRAQQGIQEHFVLRSIKGAVQIVV